MANPQENQAKPPANAHADALAALQNMADQNALPPASEKAIHRPASPPSPAGEAEHKFQPAKPLQTTSDPPKKALAPMPRPVPEPANQPEGQTGPTDPGGSGSASGFVGMLAKGMLQEPSSDGSSVGGLDVAIPVSPAPAPSAGPAEGAAPPSTPKPSSPKPIASPAVREGGRRALVPGGPRPPQASSPPHPAVELRHVPDWYATAAPIALTVSLLLAMVGLWAVMGSLALLAHAKGVPLVHPLEEGEEADLWYYMPYLMLLCLPVAGMLGWMGWLMHRGVMGRPVRKE